MTLAEFLKYTIAPDIEIVIEHQYMNWDSGEKSKTQLPVYGAEYKDGKLIIKCGEE